MFSEVGRGTRRPQISARTRAMMLTMLAGRPQRWLPKRAMMLTTEAAGRGTKRDGARAHACSRCWPGREGQQEGSGDWERAGGEGRARARAALAPRPMNESLID